jgi:membrane glycosyltransferase
MAARMRQSLAELEDQFRRDMEKEQVQSQRLQRHVRVRSRNRHIERQTKQGTVRFWILVLALIATAVGVTAAMFETLYLLLG